ncbi:hypothetical protein Bca101_024364 [Brassica carinata]
MLGDVVNSYKQLSCQPPLSDSSLLVRFSDATSLNEFTKPSSLILEECFRFRSQSELLGLTNMNTQLSDIIGEITAVKSTVVFISMPLQDHTFISVRRLMLVSTDIGLPSAAPLLRGYAKVETLTISELNEFIIIAPTRILSGDDYSIADGTAEGVFVCFDGVMTKLQNLKASDAGHMLAGEGVIPEDTQVPPFIVDMEGKSKTFTFQGGDDNNGPTGDDTVVAKVKTGGSSEQPAPDTGTAPTVMSGRPLPRMHL